MMPEPSILLHPGALIRCPHFWPFAAEATGQAGLPAASPPPMSVAPTNELLGKFPSLWGRPPASARPPGGARPSRWLTGAGRRCTHLVGRWSYGGGGGGGGVAVLRARFKAQPSDGGGHTRDADRPPQPGPGGCRVSAARRRVAAARDSGRPRAGGGAKRRLHDARRRPRCDSGDPRAAGYRLSPHLLDLAPQCPEPLAVLLLYLESFGQNVALRPRGCPRPWTSEPRGGLKSSGDRRAYLRCDLSGQRAHPSCRVLAGVPGQVAKEVVEALKGKCSRFCCLSTWVRAESGKPGIR
ncbi:unnamed protein product [Rangifer tarandus platyrhynchus]|uniref:Uncharacterized protein n=2 Tax=Rangifer tarandus platyrhynchus TaxID=3082113 RepID=A0ACB0DXX9_RANTA|nr:unnamed protein product [Rangifer tarandus platyrhynchus]CAI9693087.1 unnamed protein product [Rangifer tarandus platyrhynchus]